MMLLIVIIFKMNIMVPETIKRSSHNKGYNSYPNHLYNNGNDGNIDDYTDNDICFNSSNSDDK